MSYERPFDRRRWRFFRGRERLSAMGLTTDRDDPGLRKERPDGQQETYLVLSDEERAQGFVRPVRRTYVHVGTAGPKGELRDLTEAEEERYADYGYVKFEEYGDDEAPVTGRFWKQTQLDNVGKGCGHSTTMAPEIAETYARQPSFYGATFCAHCRTHLPVGEYGEFVWADEAGLPTFDRVGT